MKRSTFCCAQQAPAASARMSASVMRVIEAFRSADPDYRAASSSRHRQAMNKLPTPHACDIIAASVFANPARAMIQIILRAVLSALLLAPAAAHLDSQPAGALSAGSLISADASASAYSHPVASLDA